MTKECLSIVNAICLGETMSKQRSLVTCNGTIMIIFDSEDPFVCDNGCICRTRNQSPSRESLKTPKGREKKGEGGKRR